MCGNRSVSLRDPRKPNMETSSNLTPAENTAECTESESDRKSNNTTVARVTKQATHTHTQPHQQQNLRGASKKRPACVQQPDFTLSPNFYDESVCRLRPPN